MDIALLYRHPLFPPKAPHIPLIPLMYPTPYMSHRRMKRGKLSRNMFDRPLGDSALVIFGHAASQIEEHVGGHLMWNLRQERKEAAVREGGGVDGSS